MTSKRGPAKTETSAMTICAKEGCSQLSSPPNPSDLRLDPQKPEPQEPALGSPAGIESFTPETQHRQARRLGYLPRTCALTFQRCFRSAGMAVNFFPAEFFPNKLP
jgi:hypothetical protein